MKKRILSIILTLCMVISIVPITVFSANSDATALQALLDKGGTVKLTRDYTIDAKLYVKKDTTLDLNGYVIRMTGNFGVIQIYSGIKMTLKDSAPTRKHSGKNASLPDGGVITGGDSSQGGGVSVGLKSKFTMESGTIYGCKATNGGGVYVGEGANFIMNGGTIYACSATQGGGVYMLYSAKPATMTMSGGAIRGCRAKTGGGMYIPVNNTFTMTGGVIEDCTSHQYTNGYWSHAIHIAKSQFIANGGIVKGTVYTVAETKIENTNSGSCTKFYGDIINTGTISGGVYYSGIQNVTLPASIDGVTKEYTGKVSGTYYKVSFNLNGADGAVPTQWFFNTNKETAMKPANPTREGYEFKGWYNGNTAYNFTKPVTGNLSLTAKWVKNSVATEAELRQAINEGAFRINLVGDISLTSPLILNDKVIKLDLNGHVLKGDLSKGVYILLSATNSATSYGAQLFLTDSNPTATHTSTSLPSGGVLDCGIGLNVDDSNVFGSTLYADGGTVTGIVSMNHTRAFIRHTYGNTTPTAFMKYTSGMYGGIYNGIYYKGVKEELIKGNTVTFKNGEDVYAQEIVSDELVGGSRNPGVAVAPIAPEKGGFAFAGWYNGNTRYDFTKPVTGDITLTAKWVNEVNSEASLRVAVNAGVNPIKLMGDISLSSALDLSQKNVTIDLNGYVISGADISINIGNGKANLTLKDSRPTAAHTDGTLPAGGVVTSKISMKQSGGKYNDCVLYANGGTVTSEFNTNTNAVAIKCTSNTPTAFTGKISGYTHLYGGIYYGTIDSSVTVEGKKITFKIGDNTYAYEVVDSESKTVAPIALAPAKYGYQNFDGWYSGDDAYTFGFALDEDITLTAKFRNPITYNITYNLNGGTATNPTSYTLESAVITLKNPTKAGYTFTGWSGTGLSGENNKNVTIPKGSIGHRAYTANFSPKSYTVKFDTAGGNSVSDKTGVKWTDKVLDGVTTPTKAGWRFTGWKCGDVNVNSNTTYSQLASSDATASITITAQWEVRSYTVKFSTNGGNAISDKTGVKWTDKVLDGVTDPIRDGFEFAGWKCWKNGIVDVNANTAYAELASSDSTASIVLLAQWEAKDYTVKFNTDGGNAISDKTSVKWTDKVLDGITDPTKDGWQFSGWKCGDVTVNALTKYSDLVTNDTISGITLVAQWKDVAGPTGEISIGTKKWNSLCSTVTFGLFYKDTQTVTITASDIGGSAVSIGYLLSDRELTDTELAAAAFTAYTEEFSITPDNKYVIYAKLTDIGGNVTYLSSEGIVLDATAPVISGVENGKTYCEAQTVTVTEEYIESVTVNDVAVILDANNQFTLNPAEGTQKIVVTDKAGNETSVTVTVNNGHTADNDDGDCSTPVYCIYHPDTVVVAAKSHDFSGEWQKDENGHWHICHNDGCTVADAKTPHSGTDDGDCTTAVNCECGYIVTVAKTHNFSGEWQKDENGHWHKCQNDGCTVADAKTPHSGTDDGDCTTAVNCECGHIITAANAGHSYGEWQSNGNGTHTHRCTAYGCNGYEDGNCTGGEASYFKKAVCEICHKEYGEFLTDSIAPSGEISISTNKWNSFLNTITFGIFFKDTQSVTITAGDDSYSHAGYTDDEAVKVEYYLYSGDTALEKADLAGEAFTAYSSAFSINPDSKYVVYVRLTDHAGNVTYISSEGVVLDSTAPVISGVENGKTYCEAQTVTVTEDYIESVTVNDVAVILDANNQFTLNPAEGTQKIVVTDRAGNVSAEMTATVNYGHTDENTDHECDFCGANVGTHEDNNKDHACDYGCTESIGVCEDADRDHSCDYGCGKTFGTHEDNNKDHKCDYGCTESIGEHKIADGKHTCDYCGEEMTTCKDDDKDHLCDICALTLSDHTGEKATCKAKAVCEYCGEEYGEVDSSNHNLEKIPAKAATVTETGNKEYWHCPDCDNYFSDKDAKNSIDPKDTIIDKLPPEIIEGKGQSVTEGEKKELTFRSNAALSDFISVELDGKTLYVKDYTVWNGSTYITLKADYVASLSVGEHTIGIVSESGTAATTLTVKAKAVTDNDTKTPQTGDNSILWIWVALLFVSGGALIGTTVVSKKKKHSEN